MFSQHPKAIYWSNKNIKQPNEVALNSHNKLWFDCICGHKFDASLLNINKGNNWCPYCSDPPKKLCDKDNCNKCFENSFASHEKSIYWSDKNELKPRQVFKCADRRNFIFNCDKCNHTLHMNLKNITVKGHWCSYCAHQKLCENDHCEMCFNNSFASIERSKYLTDKNIQTRFLFTPFLI